MKSSLVDLIIYFITDSLFMLFALAGGIISGPLIVSLGQRKTLLSVSPIMMGAWLIHSFSPNIMTLQISRTVIGFFQGITSFCVFSYTAEISHSKFRSIFCALIDVFSTLGVLFVFVIGGATNLHWRDVAMVCAFPGTLIPFFLLLCVHDSPRWLAVQKRFDDAQKALKFFRGEKYDINSELNHIKSQLEENTNKDSVFVQFKILIKDKSIQKRVLLLSYLLGTTNFTGNVVMVSYAVVIFKSMKSSLNAYSSAILIGICRVIAVVIYASTSNKIGRKNLAIFVSSMSTFTMFAIGLFVFLSESGHDMSVVFWLPPILTVVFVFCSSIYISITNLYRNELIPNSIRPVGGACMSVTFYGFCFFILYFYQDIVDHIGLYGTFFLFGLNNLINTIVSYLALPETKGESLEEIDDKFRINKTKIKEKF